MTSRKYDNLTDDQRALILSQLSEDDVSNITSADKFDTLPYWLQRHIILVMAIIAAFDVV